MKNIRASCRISLHGKSTITIQRYASRSSSCSYHTKACTNCCVSSNTRVIICQIITVKGIIQQHSIRNHTSCRVRHSKTIIIGYKRISRCHQNWQSNRTYTTSRSRRKRIIPRSSIAYCRRTPTTTNTIFRSARQCYWRCSFTKRITN